MILKSIIFAVFSTLCCLSLFAQDNIEYSKMDSGYVFQSSCDFNAASNHIPFSTTSFAFQGGFLDEIRKQEVVSVLSENNRFGFGLVYGASFFFRPDYLADSSSLYRFSIGWSHHNLLLSGFRKDALQFILLGNAPFVGQELVFDNTRLSYYSFDKFSVAASRTWGYYQQNMITVSPFISIHQSFFQFALDRGGLYTSADTSEIKVSLDGHFLSMQNYDNVSASLGGGVDIFYSNNLLLRGYYVQLGLENIGFFNYHGSQYQFHGDSIVTLNYYNVTPNSNIDSTFSQYADSLENRIGQFDDSLSMIHSLPLKISLSFISNERNAFSVNGYFGYYPYHHMPPFVELRPTYRIAHWLKAGVPINLGGYAGFSTGVFAGINAKNLSLYLQASAAFGSGLPETITGYFLTGKIRYQF